MHATDPNEVCQHCKQRPKAWMLQVHPLWPWFAVRIGPGGVWCHYYCSEGCWTHADEHSKEQWEEHRRKAQVAVAAAPKALHHRVCGGEIYEDQVNPYEWDDEEGHHGPYPRMMCRKCNNEISGDAEIEEEF